MNILCTIFGVWCATATFESQYGTWQERKAKWGCGRYVGDLAPDGQGRVICMEYVNEAGGNVSGTMIPGDEMTDEQRQRR